MMDNKLNAYVKSKVSFKRFLWLLIIPGAVAIFGGYLLYSMSSYQHDGRYSLSELLQRSIESDGGLPFVALIIPAAIVISIIIIVALGKFNIVVTDKKIWGYTKRRGNFSHQLSEVTKIERTSATSLIIHIRNNDPLEIKRLRNCNQIYEAITGKKITMSSSNIKEHARLDQLKKLSEEQLLAKLSFTNGIVNFLNGFYAILGLGCLIFFIVQIAKWGFEYGIILAAAGPAVFAFMFLLFSYPYFKYMREKRDLKKTVEQFYKDSESINVFYSVAKIKSRRLVAVIISLSLLLSLIAVFAVSNDETDDIKTVYYTCGSCDRKFRSSSDDGRSVAKRGLCQNCYQNMKDLQNALDRQKN